MKKISILNFIKENNNPYADTLDSKIEKVEKLLNDGVISTRIANAIISYLVKKDASNLIRDNLKSIIYNPERRGQWLILNYSRRHTNYI